MDDGAPQELRDEAMRKATGASILEAQGELLGELESSWAAVNPTLWANKAENDFQFNYDPDVETKKWEVEQKVGTMLARL